MTAFTFVNHASYLQHHEGITLLTDPWVTGTAFADGWSLVTPTTVPLADLADATHIWLSHEHPDHFTPAFFRSIPEDKRGLITVLYQTTRDKKVVDFLRGAGFTVMELPEAEWVRIAPDFEVQCRTVPIGDSLLITRSKDATTINVNDCTHVGRVELEKLRAEAGPIDVLFTQFGYASWQGAPSDTALRKKLARAQLERITKQVESLRPRYVVPFASFAFFSAPENGYMNDANNRVADAEKHIRSVGAEPIVLFTGDEWKVGAAHDNAAALGKWKAKYGAFEPRHEPKSVPFEKLQELAKGYADRMLQFHSKKLVSAIHALHLGLFGPLDLYLVDQDRAVRFDIARPLEQTSKARERCAVAMHSEVLAFLLKFDWGLNTLSVNGRFVTTTGGFKKLVRAFALGSLKTDGRRFAVSLLTERAVWIAASRAVFERRS